jgi:hypothetical protein
MSKCLGMSKTGRTATLQELTVLWGETGLRATKSEFDKRLGEHSVLSWLNVEDSRFG